MSSSKTSLRSSSPVSDAGSTFQLSPRSKIRALLAAVDEDSDEEVPTVKKLDIFPDSATIADEPQPETSDEAQTRSTEESEDDEEDVVSKPRGRFAARMTTERSIPDSESGSRAESGFERVRKTVDSPSLAPVTRTIEEETEGDDEGTMPVSSRKRKIWRPREEPTISSPIREASSNPMFVSPTRNSKSPPPNDDGSDEDLPENPMANSKFLALVARKREERLAKEEEANKEKARKAAERRSLEKNHSDMLEADATFGSDGEIEGRRLTQSVRPMRKASKKAEEEIRRETQRLSRNMQLAHQAKTKKKITKASLFAKFNFKPAVLPGEDVALPAQPSSSSPRHTDAENDTPPTSPVVDIDLPKVVTDINPPEHLATEDALIGSDDDMPDLLEALSRPAPSSSVDILSKGKENAIQQPLSLPKLTKAPVILKKTFRLPSSRRLQAVPGASDSDSDLEIVTTKADIAKSKMNAIFDRVPVKKAAESHSLHALRLLAHVKSPGKEARGRYAKPSMSATELTISLQKRARQQATRDREERIQALRDRGVIVLTAEEREKEMAGVEDLVAKARREGDEITKKERAEAKREREANGEMDPLGDSSDDEDWEEEEDNFAGQLSVSASESDEDADGEENSEDEEEEEDEDEETLENDEAKLVGALVDDEASESDANENEPELNVDDIGFIDDGEELEADEEENLSILPRRRINKLVVSDEEDEEEATPVKTSTLLRTDSISAHQDSPIAPPSVLRSATKTFIPGLTVSGPAGLGLTQIFAGTMDDTQTQDFDASPIPTNRNTQQFDPNEDSLAFLRNMPAPPLPEFAPTMDEDSQNIVKDSQTQYSQMPGSPRIEGESQNIQLDFTQTQIHGFDSMIQEPLATQFSEFPELTQDQGFQDMSPIKGRFVEPPASTMDTLILGETPVPESPVVQRKKGKLRSRAEMSALAEDEEAETTALEVDDLETSANVFEVMRQASKKKKIIVDEFDKKKSGAREMVQEQADESEDEYAGLGGASDDERGSEADEYAKELIDDEAGKDADERQLAALYADRERANDTKAVEKLFKDITNGGLRRKRGADYSLSDSDDDGEARRRMKRREFAKMRKALFEDERIEKIAENPKKLAFLHAIEDRAGEDEIDFLEEYNDSQDASAEHSHSQAEGENEGDDVPQVDDSQPGAISDISSSKRKSSTDSDHPARLPPHLRRTKAAKKPSNLSEIRHSLSSLIEPPNAFADNDDASSSGGENASAAGSSSDLEIEDAPRNKKQNRKEKDKENRNPFARRTTGVQVVDRIELKRASSSTDLSTSARLAFAAPSLSGGMSGGFKVPALLRRATTNSSLSSVTTSTSGTERSASSGGGFGGFGGGSGLVGKGGEEKVARKAGKNSGVAYMARESERRIKVVEGERKREERRWKGAEGRRKVVGGLFGGGRFE